MQRRDLLHGAALLGAGASFSPLTAAAQPAKPSAESGERGVIDAYREVDSF